MSLDLIRSMADHDGHRLDTAIVKVIDARINYRLFTEREQRLKCSHSARLAGGKENCDNVIHFRFAIDVPEFKPQIETDDTDRRVTIIRAARWLSPSREYHSRRHLSVSSV